MLKWKLHELLARKRVSGSELARRMNVHINTIKKLREDRPTMLRFEYIEAICNQLPCEPAELFEVAPGAAEHQGNGQAEAPAERGHGAGLASDVQPTGKGSKKGRG